MSDDVKKMEEELDVIVKYLAFVKHHGKSAWTGLSLDADFHSHHFIHRKDKLFRWDLRNVFPLTKEEHFWIHNGAEGQFGVDVYKKFTDEIQSLMEERKIRREKAGRSFVKVMHEVLKRRFEEEFKMSFEEFKKLSSEDKWKKALEIISKGGDRSV